MKKINFSKDVLPHALAIVVFVLITILFFNPVFFGNKALNQGDINQFIWGSKELRDFRDATGEEPLWVNAMFSGMPSYMMNMVWSDGVIIGMKKIMSLFLPHPIRNIFLAFVCYYIMLLTFRVRWTLSIVGALAFGLTSYMIIGLTAGHNARIGAIAFMPLVMAGIHLAFSGKRILGFGLTAAGLALHLRESHPQVTYYLIMIVGVYGIVQAVEAFRTQQLSDVFKTVGVLVIAALLAVGTYFGPMWAMIELSSYSTRGKSELVTESANTAGSGLPKSYAFEYSNGVWEPMTTLIPDFFGGSSFHAFVNDPESETYKALVSSRDENLANQLARYSSSYWGDQPLAAPYYGGAIIVFLFVLGILLVDKKYVWWLVPLVVLSILMSWGNNFEAFNYFLFDHLPGYNKFRSVTFVLIIIFFAMPLLGMMGLEELLQKGITKEMKRKLLVAFGVTGGICLLLFFFAGALSYVRAGEGELPSWFLQALQSDRKGLLRGDALRSFAFIFSIFILLYLEVPKKISFTAFVAFLGLMVTLDMALVDTRYLTKNNYERKRDNSKFTAFPVNEAINKDKGYYRVFNLMDFYEANTSYFHHSLGGYHGVRLKRYQELYDSCISREREELINDAQSGRLDLRKYGVLNMLNAKYLTHGSEANQFIPNHAANGEAWFVNEVQVVHNPNEELEQVALIDTRTVAVMDDSKFKLSTNSFVADSSSSVRLTDHKPYQLKYETTNASDGLVVFSEIYYPKGWTATLDGKEVPILRADYVLRALEVPAGKHTIEFTFAPKPYIIGNKVTMASSWLLLLVVLGSFGWSLKKEQTAEK